VDLFHFLSPRSWGSLKTILFSLLALGINSAFAAPLIEEAICTGTIDGEEMKVISLVNPMNWCEDSASADLNAVIFVESTSADGGMFMSGEVITATMSNPTESSTVLTSTTRGVLDVRMSYSYDDEPATFDMLDENDVLQKYELTCEFPQYHIECDEE
jgi:hypothetical protein